MTKMGSFLVNLFLTSIVLKCVFVQEVTAQADCKDNCYDYNRLCPGVKDAQFYQDYKEKHEAEQLGHFSQVALAPSPNCSDPFYQYACPMSCGLCVPCTVHQSYVDSALAVLEQKLTDKIEALESAAQNQAPLSCNLCTEILGEVSNQPTCLPKYHTVYMPDGDCSCNCGPGEQTATKRCVAYEEKDNGGCEQVDTFMGNCPTDQPATITQTCNNGPCSVRKIVEKTHTDKWADSGDKMTYKVRTSNGQTCQLGIVYNEPRLQGGTNTYNATDGIEDPVCEDMCMEKKEVFDRLLITTSGTDGWKTEYVKVTVNGVNGIYKNSGSLDDKKTGTWKLTSTKQNCKAITVEKIVEKTHTSKHADSSDKMTYRAYTADGQSCQLGIVYNQPRLQGGSNTYNDTDGIENPVCEDMCMEENEVFDRLLITTSGTDGWKTEYIKVTVNGANGIYKNSGSLDDKKTGTWTLASTKQNCKAITVSKIVEKTHTSKWSDSGNKMLYRAYTSDGQSCQLGLVHNLPRLQGGTNTYNDTDGIENPVCEDMCMEENEVFDRLLITTDGTDGWKTEYIKVTMNGADGIYKNSGSLDDKKTGTWKLTSTKQNCKAITVSKIVEKTHNSKWSDSGNKMSYRAYTSDGQSCQLGLVHNQPRQKGGMNTYTATDGIESPVCEDMCMGENEVFDRILITTDGTDGWKTEYVQVTVNGGTSTYKNSKSLDDKGTGIWKLSGTQWA